MNILHKKEIAASQMVDIHSRFREVIENLQSLDARVEGLNQVNHDPAIPKESNRAVINASKGLNNLTNIRDIPQFIKG